MTNELLKAITSYEKKLALFNNAKKQLDQELNDRETAASSLMLAFEKKAITKDEFLKNCGELATYESIYSKYEYLNKDEFILRILWDNILIMLENELAETFTTVVNKYAGKQLGEKTAKAICAEVETNFIYKDKKLFFMYFCRDLLDVSCDHIQYSFYRLEAPTGRAREQRNTTDFTIYTKWDQETHNRPLIVNEANTICHIDNIPYSNKSLRDPQTAYKAFTKAAKTYADCKEALEAAIHTWNETKPTTYKSKYLHIED